MGIQNKPSLARKRLSTLAVTTTLAAVGVGVIGTGAANAATTSGVAQTQADPTNASKTNLKIDAEPGTDAGTAVATLTGTIDPSATASKVKVTIDWGDGKQDTVADGSLTPSKMVWTHSYTEGKQYTVTLQVEDGIADPQALWQTSKVTVTAPTPAAKAPVLVAAVSAKSVVAGGAVTVDLTGSWVDPSTVPAKDTTTISWGDKTADTVITGDPAKLTAADIAKLTHTYAAAGTYHLTVDLVDSNNAKATQVAYDITVNAKGAVVVKRAAGADRYATGLTISQHAWADAGKAATDALHRQAAKAVVLATGNAFPDALAGVPLAKKAQGPLLLTDGAASTTNPDVLKEIQRILPTKDTTIFVLGGEKAISKGIQTELEGKGYTVVRLAGSDRFGTALAIAQDPRAMNNPTHVILARGDEGTNHNGFADALAAGPYAANVFGGGNSAVVLSNNTTLDPATKAYVQSKLHVGEQNVAAIGGQAVTAVNSIPGADGLFVGAKGSTRYETAAMVASRFTKPSTVGVATGLKFADALTGGAYMATIGGPLLLTDPSTLSDFTSAEIGALKATTQEVDVFGGPAAVSDDAVKAVATLLGVTTIGKF
jgi:putative cell wall-binding protein